MNQCVAWPQRSQSAYLASEGLVNGTVCLVQLASDLKIWDARDRVLWHTITMCEGIGQEIAALLTLCLTHRFHILQRVWADCELLWGIRQCCRVLLDGTAWHGRTQGGSIKHSPLFEWLCVAPQPYRHFNDELCFCSNGLGKGATSHGACDCVGNADVHAMVRLD